jgi:hypothetical protein
MLKQIREQVEILCAHVERGEVDLVFVEMHATHLAQLAMNKRVEIEQRDTKSREDFMHLLGE